MRTLVRRAGLALSITLVPAAAAAGGPERPEIIEVVGDPAPADDRPRASYVVIDAPGLERAPGAIAANGPPTVFYMNKNGGTYRPGNNDARTNSSSIVDQPSSIPAWNVSASGWTQVMSCMQDLFARWNVVVTDQDPGNVPHYEIVVAGRPQHIGMQAGVGGVSPFTYNCSVIPNSIVYTFAEVYGTSYRAICETAAQEVAHSFGLDHEHLCADPMTYLSGCGAKSFQDVDAPCGEYSNRECYCGGYSQNSVEMLDDRLGLAKPDDPTDPPPDPTDPPPDPTDPPPDPTDPPPDPTDPPPDPTDPPPDPTDPDPMDPSDPSDPADPAEPSGDGEEPLITGGCSAGSGAGGALAGLAGLALLGLRRRRRF